MCGKFYNYKILQKGTATCTFIVHRYTAISQLALIAVAQFARFFTNQDTIKENLYQKLNQRAHWLEIVTSETF